MGKPLHILLIEDDMNTCNRISNYIATKDNKLCEKCPYYEDEKCENSLFTTEGMMVEAINIMREV